MLARMTCAVAIWASGVSMAYSTTDLSLRLLAVKYAYIGMVATPVLVLFFVFSYTGFDDRFAPFYRGRRWLLWWTVPAITLFGALTYPWNQLMWKEFRTNAQGFIFPAYGPGMLYLGLYAWSLMLLAVALMSWYAFAVSKHYRRDALLVAGVLLLPTISNAIYVLRLLPSLLFDVTYLVILLSVSVILYAVKNRNFLAIRPVALSMLMEQMADAVLVIDADRRIVNCNRIALLDLGASASPLGQSLPQVLSSLLGAFPATADAQPPSQDQPGAGAAEGWSLALLMDALGDPQGSSGDLVVTRPVLRHLHWRLSPIVPAGAEQTAGWVLAWRDVTQERLQLAMLYEQERALTLAVEHRRQEHELAERTGVVLAYAQSLAQAALDSIERGQLAFGIASLAHLISVAGQVHANEAWPLSSQAEDRPLLFSDALYAFLQDYGRAAGCTVAFDGGDAQLPELLSPWSLLHLVRILQELLAGIQHTMAAGALRVALYSSAEWVTLCVEASPSSPASGAGRPVAAPTLRERLAQSSAPQRVAALQGEMTVTSDDAGCHQVAIRLPRTTSQRLLQLRDLRVLLATAQPALAQALAGKLAPHGVKLVGVAGSAEETIALSRQAGPQLLLVDEAVIKQHVAVTLNRLRRSAAGAKIVVLLAGEHTELEPGSAIRNGADGCLPGGIDPDQFVAALANLLADDPPLSPQFANELLASPAPAAGAVTVSHLQLGLTDRQQEVLTLLVRGYTYREIAAQLYISERTVRYDIQEMRRQMQVADRAAIVQFAIRHNLIR